MRSKNYVIVLADGDVDESSGLAEFLASKGFTVHACSNGEDVFEACLAHRPGVTLLDLDIPGVDVLDVARQLKQDARFSGMRLIAMSNKQDAKTSAAIWDAGFNEFVPKPISHAIVLALVRPTTEMRGIVQDM